jgi:hypothetical protein
MLIFAVMADVMVSQTLCFDCQGVMTYSKGGHRFLKDYIKCSCLFLSFGRSVTESDLIQVLWEAEAAAGETFCN